MEPEKVLVDRREDVVEQVKDPPGQIGRHHDREEHSPACKAEQSEAGAEGGRIARPDRSLTLPS